MKKVINDPILGGITYTKRLRCKNIRVKVSTLSGISVSLPFWVTYAAAKEFVESNRKKILSILARQKNTLSHTPQGNTDTTPDTGTAAPTDASGTGAPSGASSGASGASSGASGTSGTPGTPGTSGTPGASSTQGTPAANSVGIYSKAELAAIRKRAKKELPAQLQLLAQKLQRQFPHHSFQYNREFIKNNRSNWGSCSSLRNINLNMHLVNLPEELRDFVIIHELCHLVHRNHGAEFHKMVDAACGGKEKEYSRQLRKWVYLLRKIS